MDTNHISSVTLTFLEPMAEAAEVVEALAPMGWPAALVTAVVVLVGGALIWKLLDSLL